jgi:hypothetical protein
MIGKNPVWVAKQHGHSVATMFRVYTAWVEGAGECDIAAINGGISHRPFHWRRLAKSKTSVSTCAPSSGIGSLDTGCPGQRGILATVGESGSKSGSTEQCNQLSTGETREKHGGEGGIRTVDGLLTRPKTIRNQQVTDSYANRVPLLPLDSPPLAVGLAVAVQPSLYSLLQV